MCRVSCLIILALALLPAPAPAGNLPAEKPVYDFKQVARLAKGLERALASRRAYVALVARVGQPANIMPPGVIYSHVAFAVYSKIKTRDDRLIPGYAIYNLYQGDVKAGMSTLAQDYPVDYFAAVYDLKVGVIIPNAKLQRALLKTIFSDNYRKLHNPRYSALANPFTNEFQNCTEFVLNVLFAAIYKTGDMQSIKTDIKAYFTPQPIEVDALKLVLATMMMPQIITTKDHAGPVATTTFPSIAGFMNKYHLTEESFTYRIDPVTLYGKIDAPDFQNN